MKIVKSLVKLGWVERLLKRAEKNGIVFDSVIPEGARDAVIKHKDEIGRKKLTRTIKLLETAKKLGNFKKIDVLYDGYGFYIVAWDSNEKTSLQHMAKSVSEKEYIDELQRLGVKYNTKISVYASFTPTGRELESVSDKLAFFNDVLELQIKTIWGEQHGLSSACQHI